MEPLSVNPHNNDKKLTKTNSSTFQSNEQQC